MSGPLKPIYLLSDSQLLFWENADGTLFLNSLKQNIENEPPKAAYIGASNADNPDFYALFVAAMTNIGIENCRMIQSRFSIFDETFLQEADIILLAGGDVRKGWDIFVKTGLKELIIKRYFEGAILMGVSAGAVQLGLMSWPEPEPTPESLFDTFKLVPCIIDVHNEKDEWNLLKKFVCLKRDHVKGLGIPSGGGLIYHPDLSFEAIRHPVYEYSIKNDKFNLCLLLPDSNNKACSPAEDDCLSSMMQ